MPAIGQSIPRKEGRAKVTGQARYVDDLRLPGMLHGVTVRSPSPRGVIRDIRYGPGIPWDAITIVTARDIPGANVVALITDDQPYLAAGTVNHAEEPVLLLAHADPVLLQEARRQRHHRDRPAAAGVHDGRGVVGRARSSGAPTTSSSPTSCRAGTWTRRWLRPTRSSRGNTTRARRSSSTSSRTGCWPWRTWRRRRRRHGVGLDAVPVLHPQGAGARSSACPAKRSASSRWRPAAASAARKSTRRSSPATRRCWRGSRSVR